MAEAHAAAAPATASTMRQAPSVSSDSSPLRSNGCCSSGVQHSAHPHLRLPVLEHAVAVCHFNGSYGVACTEPLTVCSHHTSQSGALECPQTRAHRSDSRPTLQLPCSPSPCLFFSPFVLPVCRLNGRAQSTARRCCVRGCHRLYRSPHWPYQLFLYATAGVVRVCSGGAAAAGCASMGRKAEWWERRVTPARCAAPAARVSGASTACEPGYEW